jgi:hypothetical protein
MLRTVRYVLHQQLVACYHCLASLDQTDDMPYMIYVTTAQLRYLTDRQIDRQTDRQTDRQPVLKLCILYIYA